MDVFPVTMATPLSSRISHVGDHVEAILPEAVTLGEENGHAVMLPAGTMLSGKVFSVEPGSRKKPGRLRVVLHQARGSGGNARLPFNAVFNTLLGWLEPSQEGTPIWQTAQNRSTRLLTDKLMRRLGSDRAVWAQILGINSSVIPNPTSDAFMRDYHRHEVLIGAGDLIQLRTGCR